MARLETNRPMPNEYDFSWSFKPLVYFIRAVAGVPLHFSKKASNLTILILIFIGCCIFILNLIINGPRGIDIFKFDYMEAKEQYDSPYHYFHDYPDAILQLVIDISSILYFITVPLIDITFLVIVAWNRKWNRLVSTLKKIQDELKLDAVFHGNCRRVCVIAILLLFLVCISKIK